MISEVFEFQLVGLDPNFTMLPENETVSGGNR